MDGGDLSNIIEHNEFYPFSEADIKKWCFQLFLGLLHIHGHGFIHCDLKPDNLLISRDMVVVKIADFGLAREIIPRDSDHHTNCITHRAKTTLWYRAPEALLNSNTCGQEVDMWAMGVIMAELFNLSLMVPGQSEDNQMLRICQVIGSPSMDTWPERIELAKAKGYQFPECNAKISP
ncbi:cyclin-dependent kinase F-4-like [Rutidosis leptorrhynchoides]|uniref:cyclin-dependent kinase F-4-like n=1 Tax=Rutidosis leptorrhynchoides TaxID=125765 RepID=UPI003A99A240